MAIGCLILILIPVFLFIIGALFGDDSSSPSTSNTETKTASTEKTLSTGEEGILNNQDDPTNCDGNTIVGITEEAFDAFLDAQNANDTEGVAELLLAGQIMRIPNCTTIRKIDSTGTFASIAKIRVVDSSSDFYNQVGFTPFEFAINAN